MYIHNYTCIYTYMCAYTHVWLASLTYSSVAVDHDGNWLEHRGDKDFVWHLGLIGTRGHDCVYHRSLCPGADTIKVD